jgi:hypothetical protein
MKPHQASEVWSDSPQGHDPYGARIFKHISHY